jgi:outer membrane biosynthesis protein TonB
MIVQIFNRNGGGGPSFKFVGPLLTFGFTLVVAVGIHWLYLERSSESPVGAAATSSTTKKRPQSPPKTNAQSPEKLIAGDGTEAVEPTERLPIHLTIPTPTAPNRSQKIATPRPEAEDTATNSASVTIPVRQRNPTRPLPPSTNRREYEPIETGMFDAPQRQEPPDAPLRILSQPAIHYPVGALKPGSEARVRLAVVFRANGVVSVERVVESLGPVMDEAAKDVAAHIRFQPQRQAGRPIDSEHMLTITIGKI